jgi:hypothetical protein
MLDDPDIKIEINNEEEAKNPMQGIFAAALGGTNAKNLVRWALYAIKAEITFSELRFILYWTTLIELGLMIVSFVLLLFMSRFIIFLHVLHFIRPYFGCKLISSLPRSHEIFEELPSLTDTPAMQPVVFAHFQRGNRIASKYAIVTVICMVLDVVGCIISFTVINGDHNADLFYGLVAWIFLCFDSGLIFWYNTLRWMYPDEIWQNIRKVLRGGLSTTQAFLSNFVANIVSRYRNRS